MTTSKRKFWEVLRSLAGPRWSVDDNGDANGLIRQKPDFEERDQYLADATICPVCAVANALTGDRSYDSHLDSARSIGLDAKFAENVANAADDVHYENHGARYSRALRRHIAKCLGLA